MGRGSDKYQVPAVVGAIKILRELASQSGHGVTQSELVAATSLSKSTMHNLLSTLETHDYVRRDPDTRAYQLGGALISLGAAASQQINLIRSAVERIAPLADQYDMSFALAQRVGDQEVQVIERFYPPHGVHVGITLGSIYGPLDGALGKILLAAMDPAGMKRLIESQALPAHTKSTITSPRQLIEEIEATRRRGWAVSRGELNENLALATGIRGQSGELELLLLALGFPGQFEADWIRKVGELLRSVAESVMTESGIEDSQP